MSKSLFLLAQVLVISRPEIHTINIIRIFQIILQTEHIISYRTNQNSVQISQSLEHVIIL